MTQSSAPVDFSGLVLHQLWQAFRAGQRVECINAYRGVPVVSQAVIAMVGSQYAGLSVEPRQAACMALARHTYLRGASLDAPVRAELVSADVGEGAVLLARFSLAGDRLGERLSARVQPREPLPVEIETPAGSQSGTLADLSSGGVGLYAFGARIDEGLALRRGDPLEMDLRLPAEDAPVRLRGLVTSVTRLADGSRRVGARVTRDPQAERVLAAYLSRREIEIRVELDRSVAVMKAQEHAREHGRRRDR